MFRISVTIALAFCAVLAMAGMAPRAHAQVTEAQVIQQCKDKTPLPNSNWTYKVAFTDTWTDVQWAVQNPFPGRNQGDVHVELIVSASANFSCTPDLNGSNPNNLPVFTIEAAPRGVAYLGDEQACATQGGRSVMTLAFQGQDCLWPYKSGFPTFLFTPGMGPTKWPNRTWPAAPFIRPPNSRRASAIRSSFGEAEASCLRKPGERCSSTGSAKDLW